MKQIQTECADKLTPAGTMMVVRRDDPKLETETGILLPSQHVEAPDTGTILSVGPDVDFGDMRRAPVGVVGSRVAFTKYGGVKWDEQHILVRQADVMCFIED
jgi:co-chaperonin GroES (HSP10)